MIKSGVPEITDRSEAMLEEFRARYEREGLSKRDSMVFHPLRTALLTVEGSTRLDVVEGHWARANDSCCVSGYAGPTRTRNLSGASIILPTRVNPS